MFDRETRREKIIEGKMREVRLKGKGRISTAVKESVSKAPPQMTAADLMLEAAEKDFNELLMKVNKPIFNYRMKLFLNFLTSKPFKKSYGPIQI